ncbi:hypothetical protein DRJ25_05735 [Candidatus Woesearchaeota archaeon]|nr:MAG: hypothetical protein DRJ25_05735 [Candidatus Woesearchaeota archaeon]
MRKSLVLFSVLAALLLLVACQPKVEKKQVEKTSLDSQQNAVEDQQAQAENFKALEVDSEVDSDVDDLNISDLDEFDDLDKDFEELEGLDI